MKRSSVPFFFYSLLSFLFLTAVATAQEPEFRVQCNQLQPGIQITTISVGEKGLSGGHLQELIDDTKTRLNIGEPVMETDKSTGRVKYSVWGAAKVKGEAKVVAEIKGANKTTIQIINRDSPGEGLNDNTPASPVGGNNGTTRGAQRLNSIVRAATVWQNYLDSGVTIRVEVNFDPLECDSSGAVLGAAGPNVVIEDAQLPNRNTFYSVAQASALLGEDADPSGDDISAAFNTTLDAGCLGGVAGWYYGFDGNAPSNRIDFTSTILHEIVHGLGFLSLTDESNGQLFQGLPGAYDLFLFDEITQNTWGRANGQTTMTNTQRVNSARSVDDLTWNGPLVNAASGFLTSGRRNGNGRVLMYAPNPVEPGSSISHFDESLFPHELMEPIADDTVDQRLTEALLADIGWPVNVAQPEINVIRSGFSVPDNTATVSFGTVEQNATAPTITFTVSNTGTAALTTSGLSVPTGFTVTEGLSSTINAGASDNFTVRLNTTTIGTFSGTLTFANNDSDENPFNFTINGTITAPATPAVVTGVSSSTANGIYGAGATISIQVTFNTPVTVSGGTPQLLLETGTVDRSAAYVSGSGTSTLNFNYTVQNGDFSADLSYVGANSLTLNGATIRNVNNTSFNATLTLPAPGATGSLNVNKQIVISAVPLGVVSINLLSPSAEFTNTTGSLVFQVTFTAAIDTNSLSTTDFTLTRVSGTGTGAFIQGFGASSSNVYNLTVSSPANNTTYRIDVLGNATISDTLGNALNSTFTSGQTYSIDRNAPTVVISSALGTSIPQAPTTIQLTFNESVTGLALGDFVVTNGSVSQLSGSGGAYSVTFTPVAVGAASIGLAANAVQDAAGNSIASSTPLNLTVQGNPPGDDLWLMQ
ncbi:MAG: choice-of-anchor D domain-containing protein [Candidatus Sumerlaeia bacterium]|nr:choice-of-anchor D domain-containing protein [Candidatus Sumerlaeia bacterium]